METYTPTTATNSNHMYTDELNTEDEIKNDKILCEGIDPTPLYKLRVGVAASSEGIACARLAGQNYDHLYMNTHILSIFSNTYKVHILYNYIALYVYLLCKHITHIHHILTLHTYIPYTHLYICIYHYNL